MPLLAGSRLVYGPLPCLVCAALLPWPCRTSRILNLVDSSHRVRVLLPPDSRHSMGQTESVRGLMARTSVSTTLTAQESGLLSSQAWVLASFLFPISFSARSIHGADYAISDNACCPSQQASTQNRLRVSGAPISNPARLPVHACPSECWSSRSSSPGLPASLGLEFLSLACLSIIFGGPCTSEAAGCWWVQQCRSGLVLSSLFSGPRW